MDIDLPGGGHLSYTPDPDEEDARTLARLDIAAQLGADLTVRLHRVGDVGYKEMVGKVERTEDGYRFTPRAAE